MLNYYKIVAGICAIGALVSLVVMLFVFPVGVFLLIANLICLSSASKQIKKREQKR